MKTQLTKNRSCVLILEARPRLLVNREGRLFVTADTFTAFSFRCSGIIFTAIIESIVAVVTFRRRNRKRILRFFPDD